MDISTLTPRWIRPSLELMVLMAPAGIRGCTEALTNKNPDNLGVHAIVPCYSSQAVELLTTIEGGEGGMGCVPAREVFSISRVTLAFYRS